MAHGGWLAARVLLALGLVGTGLLVPAAPSSAHGTAGPNLGEEQGQQVAATVSRAPASQEEAPADEAPADDAPAAGPPPEEPPADGEPAEEDDRDPQAVQQCVEILHAAGVTEDQPFFAPFMADCYIVVKGGGTFTVRPAHPRP